MGNILSVYEAKDCLRLDSDFNDTIIKELLDSVDEYIFVATGKRWGDEDPVNPLAKSAARIQLRIEYFNETDELTNRRLSARIIQLQMKKNLEERQANEKRQG